MTEKIKGIEKAGRADSPVRIMEVCGTHTAAIYRSGLRSLLPENVKLVSGPGCPVCVTPPSYIDKCIETAKSEDHLLLCFGDMLKVPGNDGSTLSELGASGGNVKMIYSPFEAVKTAQDFPEKIIVAAAVGFETTAPAYALLLEEAEQKGLQNIRLITSLKSAIAAIEWICAIGEDVDAFICPGHVSTITGAEAYEPIAAKYDKPFVVAGFKDEHVAEAVWEILDRLMPESNAIGEGHGRVGSCSAGDNRGRNRDGSSCAVSVDPNHIASPARHCVAGEAAPKHRESNHAASPARHGVVLNLYSEAVRKEGNLRAKTLIDKYFKIEETVWRGLGAVPASGYFLRPEYEERDIDWGERRIDVSEDDLTPAGCSCGDVILGRKEPCECDLFGKICTPLQPVGPCMVSSEGACGIAFRNI
jgi:hydrogenase maturation factor